MKNRHFNLLSSMIILAAATLMLCAFLPQAEGAINQCGVTTTGTTAYPTATFGNIGSGTSTGGVANILVATNYTLSVSGTLTKIGAYAPISGHWKLGIYTDNSGSPGTLLAANNNANPVVAGYNSFDVGPVYLTAGTYWIAILTDAANRRYEPGTPNQAAYRLGYGFANNLPSNFGTPTGMQNNDYVAYATYVQVEGYAKATKVTLTDDNAVISSASFYSHTTGSYRLAIYNDNSGPNAKLWESLDTAAVAGWNTINIGSGSPATLDLQSGTYWLVWQWNSANTGPSYTAGNSGDGRILSMEYGGFPATWSGGTSSSETWSIYMTYSTLDLTILPENPWGSVAALLVCFGGFAAFVKSRKKKNNN